MKTNKDNLVIQAVGGIIHQPMMGRAYRVGHDGVARILPGTGSITYNVEVGDLCFGLVGDHIEPGVSLYNNDRAANEALNHLACIGNEATVVSGDAKGAKGIVTGKHGGVDHIIIYFKQTDLERMTLNDTIQIKGYGLGLAVIDHPEISLMNIDPTLLDKLNVTVKDDKIIFPVTTVVPAHLMGSGTGSTDMQAGDYDIMTHDINSNEALGLDKLRLGDIVAIADHYARNGAYYLKGALTIGVIAHANSYSSGHGPGVTVIATAKQGHIEYIVDSKANIANYIK